jgi:hypothetical protein
VTELGSDDFGWSNGLRFDGGEPAGIASDGAHRLLVCDTNHHRIIELTCDDSPHARVWAA